MNARPEWRPALFLLPATIMIVIALVAAVPANAVEECCTIVSVDQAVNTIVVRETATGRTKTLTIANKRLLQQLQPGAAYGPGAIDGIPEAPDVFEPDWADDCCNFRALAVGQTSAGSASQGTIPKGTIQKIEECCNIVSVDQANKQIVVRETATGLTKTLTIANAQLLQQLQPGAMYGPGAIDGIKTPPGDYEPDWAEDCCNFQAKVKAGEPQHSFTQQVESSAQALTRSPSAEIASGVTITVDSLKRMGTRVVRLDFTVHNGAGSVIYLNQYNRLMGTGNSVTNVSLVDYEGGLRYGVVKDSDGACTCSREIANEIPAGEASSYWALITSPPEGVTAVSIDFAGAALLDNVPIQAATK